MAEDINKKGMHNGFETLVKAIEELAGNKVDLSSLNKKDDVATLRAMDAKRASIELAKERLENTKIAKEAVERAQAKQSYNLAFNSLLAFLSSKKQYPLKAKRLNQEGECVIDFKVDKTGKVVSASLKKSSDYPLLDRECNNLASKAVGYDSKIVDRELNVYVPVSFKLTSL